MNNVTELLTAYETAVKLNCELTKQDIALGDEIVELEKVISGMEERLLSTRREICDTASMNSALIKTLTESTKVLDAINLSAQDSIHNKSLKKSELVITSNNMHNELLTLVTRKSEVVKVNELLNDAIKNTNQK